MSTYRLLKGHNLKLSGEPQKTILDFNDSGLRAIHPCQYKGMKPKLTVKQGDTVKKGEVLLYDKTKESVKIVSPVCGEIQEIVFGKRRIVEKILIKKTGEESIPLASHSLDSASEDELKKFLSDSGMWPYFRQRPFSKVPDPDIKPRSIFVSMHNTAPFSVDLETVLCDHEDTIQKGLRLLGLLTDGDVYLSLKKGSSFLKEANLGDAKVNYFGGPHPSGNIGVQIHHISPIANKDDIVWYISAQDLINLTQSFIEGKYCFNKIIAFGGKGVNKPSYYNVERGTLIKDVLGEINSDKYRVISGDVLSGSITTTDHSFGPFDEVVSVISEIQERDFLGWALPGFDKYSLSNTFVSSAMKKQSTDLRTGLNGSIRAIIPFGRWESLLPMDILPDFLVKSILAEDIEQMEKLGIYECDPEDFSLCAFACQSKIEVSAIINSGLELVEKEG